MKPKPGIAADGRFWRAAGAFSAALIVSACTSATIDTVATGLQPAPMPGSEAVMALGDADMMPDPDVRPGAPVGVADAGPVADDTGTQAANAFAGPTPTAPTAVALGEPSTTPAETGPQAQPVETALAAGDDTAVSNGIPPDAGHGTAGADLATQRIMAAENAPTAASPDGADAEAPTAVASAPQPANPTASIARGQSDSRNRPGFLNALFGSRRDDAGRPRPLVATASASETPRRVIAEPADQPRPVIASASARGSAAGLPGFSRERAFGINSDDGAGEDAPVQLASAAGLARLAPNGLRTQHSGVDVACLKPALVRVLKRIEQRYGQPVIITSGYRSPSRNRAARGAKNSLHMYCAAADIQVPGVSKWDLAAYLRSVPGRGGVGTYCHTKSVHIDIGPKRDWNWRCRRGG
ncbi:MAG: D-Ala-D-Ala carboxypeptidase family metallohydrolase [Roseitalea porphyridii]|uniref:D-Ala-D-Ala carboxypeptidase family metallohydrolase n=1 Tax=Roseitalea porphyridii TaxID=1852022 RepID=UPI0032ECABEA